MSDFILSLLPPFFNSAVIAVVTDETRILLKVTELAVGLTPDTCKLVPSLQLHCMITFTITMRGKQHQAILHLKGLKLREVKWLA